MKRLFLKQSTPLIFGGAAVSGEGAGYGFGEISEDKSIELLHMAFDLGIYNFDTAPIYGFGLSEKRIGKAFAKKREKVFIVSKSGVTWHDNRRVNMSNEPQIALKMLHQSLTDLESDYIDLYMIHWPDERVDIRRPLEVLEKEREKGKIRHIGLCNTNREDLFKAKEVTMISAVQSELNLLQRSVVHDLFPILKEEQIPFMSWGTLDKGILTGRVNENRKFDKNDCRGSAPWWKKQNLKEKLLKVEQLKRLIEKRGHTLTELALAHNLIYPEVEGVLCGPRSIDQLISLHEAFSHLPQKEIVEEILLELEGQE